MTRLAALITALAALAGCAGPQAAAPGPAPSASAAAPVLPDSRVSSLVQAMVQRTPKKLDAQRLADGLVPPTNRWYSGLVFGTQPQPVFPLPLGFALTGDGFAFGLPKVTASADTIAGGYVADVAVGVGAARPVVATSDPSVVGIDNLSADGARLGRTTIAQGSPFVSWVAAKAATVTIPAGFAASGDVQVATINGTRYALATSHAQVDGTSVTVDEGGSLTFWPVPEGHEPGELAKYAAVLTGSSTSYRLDADQVSTTLAYAGGDTAIARMPHQGTDGDCSLGSYPSVYGTMPLCVGSSLTWTTPRTQARASLDLSGLSGHQRDELGTQLDADIAALPPFPADTYFGGKALQRTAMLLMVADQLKLTDRADKLASVLDEQLTKWTDPKGCDQRPAFCFVYDPEAKGLVGLTPSFGSDEYNDHHFHYGYFLYAAAVLAGHDPSVVPKYAPVLDLVAADIASSGNRSFPDRRTFDAYASHSWASGTAPFADGNNQESVSEAINADAGLALWAKASGDTALADEANWMLSLEAHDSATYWLQPDLTSFPGYQHRITVLNWGGKRDYATWFSPEPAAKLGILLLPMSPTSTYLGGDPDAVRANVTDAVGGNFDQKFGDYILMYSALAGSQDRDRAVEAARKLSDGSLDDGMSRTYLLAWLFSR
jgi:hypothetical protein